jgi:hypothetical protein
MSQITRSTRLPVAGAVLAALLLVATPALAQQRSIQLEIDINKAFETVERNKAGFDAAVAPAREKLEALARRSADLSRRMGSLPGGLRDDERAKRMQELRAESVQVQAEYLQQATTVVTEATKLIAGNMTTLDGLARRLEKTEASSPDAKRIEARIEKQAETGRQIMREIRAIHEMAAADPALSRRMNSLVVTASSLDRSITLEKARLEASRLDGLATDQGRVIGMIDVALNEMADMYTALESDKVLLRDLREEVDLAVNLGLLEITKNVVRQSLPALSDLSGDSVVPGITDMISSMRAHNRALVRSDTALGASEAAKPNAPPAGLPMFKNF